MTDEQTPDPHAALIAEVNSARRGSEFITVDGESIHVHAVARTLADALVREKARADAAEAATDEYDQLIGRQGDLLTGVVNAIKGNPPPLTTWSHHDAPELAQAEKARADAAERALGATDDFRIADWQKLETERDDAEARADRLADIVREARSVGGWDAVAVLAQAEAEGLL